MTVMTLHDAAHMACMTRRDDHCARSWSFVHHEIWRIAVAIMTRRDQSHALSWSVVTARDAWSPRSWARPMLLSVLEAPFLNYVGFGFATAFDLEDTVCHRCCCHAVPNPQKTVNPVTHRSSHVIRANGWTSNRRLRWCRPDAVATGLTDHSQRCSCCWEIFTHAIAVYLVYNWCLPTFHAKQRPSFQQRGADSGRHPHSVKRASSWRLWLAGKNPNEHPKRCLGGSGNRCIVLEREVLSGVCLLVRSSGYVSPHSPIVRLGASAATKISD